MIGRPVSAGAEVRADTFASLAAELTAASLATGRLAQSLDGHPLAPAILFRARLDAVRRMAAADGQMIDPWHLAAVLEGLRLRMDAELRIVDRGMIFDAARHALALYQWLAEPDFDQEGEVQRAQAHLAATPDKGGPILTAGHAFHSWIDRGESRAPIRVALVRYWERCGIFRIPLPLTGAGALGPGVPWQRDDWLVSWVRFLAGEAADSLELVRVLDGSWRSARSSVAGRRKTSHAAAAIDLLAAAPLVSATSLAGKLGIAVKNSLAMLDGLRRDGIVIEVTHRTKRRLFALGGLAPLRDNVAGPRRPDPTRRRGRPVTFREQVVEDVAPSPPPPSSSSMTGIAIDYGDLELAIANLEETIRRTRASLNQIGLMPLP